MQVTNNINILLEVEKLLIRINNTFSLIIKLNLNIKKFTSLILY